MKTLLTLMTLVFAMSAFADENLKSDCPLTMDGESRDNPKANIDSSKHTNQSQPKAVRK